MDQQTVPNQLTAEQRQRVERRRLDFMMGSAALGLVVIGLLLIIGLVVSGQPLEIPILLLIPLFGLWGWLLREQPRQWQRVNLDLAEGKVETLDGTVRGEVAQAPGFVRFSKYRLCIGSRYFQTDQRIFFATPLGSPVRLIYTPHAEIVVETQPLSGYRARTPK